jgi:hypothetical protein
MVMMVIAVSMLDAVKVLTVVVRVVVAARLYFRSV